MRIIPNQFTLDTLKLIKNIPKGKVLTYGRIAKLAGNPRAARQISWILHSSTRKYKLPWHRVINSKGQISLKQLDDKNYQKALLEKEGIYFQKKFELDLDTYMWNLKSIEEIENID
ncbi:MAG: MGMT family protein [Candidatus Lokiarchaeota archaeon]